MIYTSKFVHNKNTLLTNDNIANCGKKIDVIEIIFDHITSTTAISIVFTCMKVDEKIECEYDLKSINRNKLFSIINNVVSTDGKYLYYVYFCC